MAAFVIALIIPQALYVAGFLAIAKEQNIMKEQLETQITEKVGTYLMDSNISSSSTVSNAESGTLTDEDVDSNSEFIEKLTQLVAKIFLANTKMK